MTNITAKLRKTLNKNKPKKIRIKKIKDTTLIMCPIKSVNIYKYICIEKCTYYEKCIKGELG